MAGMIILALGLNLMEKVLPDAIYWLYAWPAAFLTSLFLGSHPLITGPQEITIPLARQSIHVIPSCSAYGFFCLLYAMSVVYLFRRFKPLKAAAGAFLILPLVYGLTVFTNSCRIVCAYYVSMAGRVLWPSSFQAAAHLGVGVAVFLSVLMGVYLFLERTGSDAKRV